MVDAHPPTSLKLIGWSLIILVKTVTESTENTSTEDEEKHYVQTMPRPLFQLHGYDTENDDENVTIEQIPQNLTPHGHATDQSSTKQTQLLRDTDIQITDRLTTRESHTPTQIVSYQSTISHLSYDTINENEINLSTSEQPAPIYDNIDDDQPNLNTSQIIEQPVASQIQPNALYGVNNEIPPSKRVGRRSSVVRFQPNADIKEFRGKHSGFFLILD